MHSLRTAQCCDSARYERVLIPLGECLALLLACFAHPAQICDQLLLACTAELRARTPCEKQQQRKAWGHPSATSCGPARSPAAAVVASPHFQDRVSLEIAFFAPAQGPDQCPLPSPMPDSTDSTDARSVESAPSPARAEADCTCGTFRLFFFPHASTVMAIINTCNSYTIQYSI